MYPEDRVLVGVVNRVKDLDHVRYDHWYRIPHGRISGGIHAEYLAFFLSRAFGEQNGAIHFYARRTGHELVRRQDLLPDEASHPRASQLYYKVQLGELRDRVPPVENPTRRPITFIYTTWDRFMAAKQISDLYSMADYFVDRVYYALRNAGIPAERTWEAERISDDGGAQLRVLCREGEVVATTASGASRERVHLPPGEDPEAIREIIADVRARIQAMGGPLSVAVPLEH